uniref:SNF-related serine/threonine-protein kinase n=1 Tax=Anopheles coluzzii TaxID=1518534 RepID=A0A8W7PMT7_ANOCL
MQRSFGGLSAASRAGVYDGKIAGLYDLEETLGSGHFAVVKLARHVFTGEKVAVKVIEKTKLDEISRAHLFQEVRCMKLVQHPNVVRLYEVIDTQTKLYLILELGDGGDLYDYIMRHEKGLSENVAREYFRQIVRAISYCHQLHVVHRDLKPENVVFFEKLGVVKLTDFGFSNKFCPGQKLETSCGSLAYSAPEILLGDSYDAPAVDVWSLGVILFMLVCGHPPFQEANDSETLTMIMDCKYTMPAHVSDGCRNLISKMLVREPEKRATLQQIALDVWLMEGSCEETPENQPLVSREQVSEEDHTLIIQKMINGKIATKEEILEALDRNEYNHITATYFLLAERKLRAHRQEEAQKRKPELTLPVSNSTRLLQNFKKNEANEDEDTQDGLLSTRLGMHLSVPRTPGTETGQTGRSRKCSIVQEEEDDEDDVHCAGHEELSTPLNRRGSRSEGRINVTVQDRIAESERLKLEAKKYQQSEQQSRLSADEESDRESQPAGKDQVDGGDAGNHQRAHPQTSPLLGGIGNVTLVTSENSSTKDRLGIAGGGLHRKPMPELKRHVGGSIDSKKSSILKPTLVKITDGVVGVRSGSFDQCMRNMAGGAGGGGELVTTKIITDSSTITIPIPTLNIVTASTIPKYKTMPSPTRSNAILTSTTNCLNEIFEEGTDVGSSDSTSTTPRPVIRSQFVAARQQSQPAGNGTASGAAAAASTGNNVHRRTKFNNKSRTASCSSSDASDDDSENRKKRAHKIHGASNRQKSSQPVDFRRHRGRRRPVETRLRESQSLNRITEVQESEVGGGGGSGGGGHSVTQQLASSTVVGTPLVQMVTSNGAVAKPTTEPPNATDEQQSDKSCDNASSDRASAEPEPEPPACREAGTPSSTKKGQSGKAASPRQHHHGTSKPKGLSARIFHTFKKQPVAAVTTTTTAASVAASAMSDPPSTGSADDIEIVVELAKALNNASAEGGKTGNTKKIKILGRYFQVHKKIYVPLSGLFQRGRLYKAQSCGSIVRDKVNVNPNGGGAGSHANTTGRHSTIFTDKNRIIKNCLGGGGGGEAAARHLGSDGDINHNGGSHHQHHQQLHSSSGFLASLSATGGGVGASSECIGRGSSPIELVSAGRRSSIVDHATPVLGATAVTPPVPIKTA